MDDTSIVIGRPARLSAVSGAAAARSGTKTMLTMRFLIEATIPGALAFRLRRQKHFIVACPGSQQLRIRWKRSGAKFAAAGLN